VKPAVPVRSLSDLISYAKSNPGKLRVGFAGYGTPQHTGIELFKMMAGVDLTLVPAGSTPALADLMAGSVDAMFDPMPSSIAHIKSGKLLPLAVTGPTRSEALRDFPAATDFVPGYEAGSWFGICAPKLTPCGVVDKLNMVVGSALDDTGIGARLSDIGASAMPGSPVEFGKFIGSRSFASTARLSHSSRWLGVRARLSWFANSTATKFGRGLPLLMLWTAPPPAHRCHGCGRC
jgi:tripartite-type tricarboxylate transporter receptor subunit TctC